jgi:hypothetical protein
MRLSKLSLLLSEPLEACISLKLLKNESREAMLEFRETPAAARLGAGGARGSKDTAVTLGRALVTALEYSSMSRSLGLPMLQSRSKGLNKRKSVVSTGKSQ